MNVFYVSSSFHSVSSCTLRFAETLEVHDLTGTQELDDVIDIRVIGKTENVVIGNAGLLLCCDGIRTTQQKSSAFKFCPERCSGILDSISREDMLKTFRIRTASFNIKRGRKHTEKIL